MVFVSSTCLFPLLALPPEEPLTHSVGGCCGPNYSCFLSALGSSVKDMKSENTGGGVEVRLNSIFLLAARLVIHCS